MKKIIIVVTLISGILIGQRLSKTVVTEIRNQTISTPTPGVGIPKHLIIDKLKIKAEVETVGLAKDGNMDIPTKAEDVGWYEYGTRPGDKGRAVIAGHLDWYTGPAVFWHLDQLQKGDIIKINDEYGKETDFAVDKIVMYEDANFPVNEVFGNSDRTELNLITCSGVFNKAVKAYNKRLVVFSKKI